MAKHAAPQSGDLTAGPTAIVIRPVPQSAEAYLGRLRAAAASVLPTASGRHARA